MTIYDVLAACPPKVAIELERDGHNGGFMVRMRDYRWGPRPVRLDRHFTSAQKAASDSVMLKLALAKMVRECEDKGHTLWLENAKEGAKA